MIRTGGRTAGPACHPTRTSREFALLLATAVDPAGDRSGSDPVEALATNPDIDWPRALQLADQHRTLPLLHASLARRRILGTVPAEAREALLAAIREQSAANLSRTAELGVLLRALRDEQIPVLTFKGPSLAMLAYGSLALRAFGDLDLIVHPRDFERACRTIERAGYAPRGNLSLRQQSHKARIAGQVAFLGSSGHMVDMHCALLERDSPPLLDFSTLWDARQTVALPGGQVAATFDDLHLALFLLVHGRKHHWTRLGWVIDCLRTLERLPGSRRGRLKAEARRRHFANVTEISLALVTLLGMNHPVEGAPESPINRSLASHYADAMLQQETLSRGFLLRLDWLAKDRLRDRLRLIFMRSLVPQTTDWDATRFPDSLIWLCWLTRPWRVLREGLRRI